MQLMPSEELIQEKFGFSDFLTRHAQVVDGSYIDAGTQYGDDIPSNRRYLVIDSGGKLVASGDEDTDKADLTTWITTSCESYNCHARPAESDVDADGTTNGDILELDIDADGIDDADHASESDTDGDGILNIWDLDIDCDGQLNIYDTDADGD